MASPNPFPMLSDSVLDAEPVPAETLFADAKYCVLLPDETGGLDVALTLNRTPGKRARVQAYRWMLTEALAGRPVSAEAMHGRLALLLGVETLVDRRATAELVAIANDRADGSREPGDELASMVHRSRAQVLEWRSQPGFQNDVDYWRTFFRDHPDAEFPLHWAQVDWWLDGEGYNTAPDLLARKILSVLRRSPASHEARLALHDLMYWFAHRGVVLTDILLVALGEALELVHDGSPDLSALWGAPHTNYLREVAERDGASGGTLTAAELARPYPDPESFRKVVQSMRKRPAYRLIAADAASPKSSESLSVR